MRFITYIILTVILASSCQNDKLIKEDFIGEWKYERELSSISLFPLNLDKKGIITFYSEGTGGWIQDLGLISALPVNNWINFNWKFNEINQQVEIIKTVNHSDRKSIRVYDIKKEGVDIIKLVHKTETITSVNPINVIVVFEHIQLTRN